MTDAAVSLFVEVRAAGLLSLIEQTPGERNERHLPSDLFENPDEASFYRAAAKWIADWAGKGVRIEYADVDSRGNIDFAVEDAWCPTGSVRSARGVSLSRSDHASISNRGPPTCRAGALPLSCKGKTEVTALA